MTAHTRYVTLMLVGWLGYCAVCAPADGSTTILTHGYSLDQTKGVWVESMADTIIARARAEGLASPNGGAVLRYDQTTAIQGGGAWRLVSGSPDPDEPVVLIYRWLQDFDKAGPNIGFAEAAADALYAALNDPIFIDGADQLLPTFDLVHAQPMHFIGHSRGAIVNSETIQRFGAAGITIDHMTALDPHPVDGTLDAPWSNFDWGDPTPQRWENITFADNYYRADGGGFFGTNAFDFDGIPIPGSLNIELDEAALDCCAYTFAHSDTHLWYHGTIDLSPTPCDGEQCINAQMRSSWWPDGFTETGFYYAALGGGSALRPGPQSPTAAPGQVPMIFNGHFDDAGVSGWLYHGGSLSTGQIASAGGETFLRLNDADAEAAHNRFYLAENAGNFHFDYDITTGATGTLTAALTARDGAVHVIATINLDQPTGGWIRDHTVLIPLGTPRGQVYRLNFNRNAPGAVVGIDNIVIDDALRPCPADCAPDGGNGLVNVDDLFRVINGISTQALDCDIAPLPGALGGGLPLAPGGNGAINIDDLVEVINAFGACP